MKFLVRLFITTILCRITMASRKNILLPMSSNMTISTLIKETQLLRISTVHFEPYMYQDSDGYFYNGIEYNLLKIIAKRLNTTLAFQSTTKHSDICNNVSINISDICIGGILPNVNLLQYTEISVTYGSDDLTWCVPKAGIMPMFLGQMLSIATSESWIGIIFGYGYPCGLILYLMIQFDLKYEQRNNRDWHYTTLLVALPACIGVSPRFYPTGSRLRVFYAFMLVSALFFFQILFTRTYEALHQQVPWHQVSSLKELMENDFRIMGSQEAFNLSQKIRNHKIEFIDICEHINECMGHLYRNYDIAVGGSRQNILNSPLYSQSKVYCFDGMESIATYPIALYMRKGFHLKNEVNDIVQEFIEAGLFDKWREDSRLQQKYEKPYEIPLRLPITHITASLIFLLGPALFMSIGTLIIENLVSWKIKRRAKHKIWIYLEQFLDGHRHYLINLPERLHGQNETYVYERGFSYLE